MTDKDEKKSISNLNVSVVIPNFNGQNLLKKFLPSVLSVLRDGDELVIVDDCSTDHSISWLIDNFKLQPIKRSFESGEIPKDYNPDIHCLDFKLYQNKVIIKTDAKKTDDKETGAKKPPEKLKNKTISILLVSQMINLRFGATSNVGVLLAKHSKILLLNNDVKPVGNIVNQLLSHFCDNQVFAVGCLEYERNESGSKSGKNKLWFSEGIFKHSKADNFKTGDTDWVSGGSGMFDRKKWLELGGFDKLFYPAYWEDTDLSFRARKKGWKVLFDEEAVVFHIHESTNTNEFGRHNIVTMSWKSADKFILKNGNWWQKILFYIYKPLWNFRRMKVLTK